MNCDLTIYLLIPQPEWFALRGPKLACFQYLPILIGEQPEIVPWRKQKGKQFLKGSTTGRGCKYFFTLMAFFTYSKVLLFNLISL